MAPASPRGPSPAPDTFAPGGGPWNPSQRFPAAFRSPSYSGQGQPGSQFFYSSAAYQAQVVSDLGSSIQVTSVTGLPSLYPFKLLLEWGTAYQEVVVVTSAPAGNGPYTFTGVIRGCDGGGPQVTHLPGAQVNHGVSAGDFGQTAAVFNACSYGADPSGTQDSAGAVQAAISACAAAGGGDVYVPAGTYLLSFPPVISTPGITFICAGAYSTVFKPLNPANNCLNVVSPGGINDVIMEGFQVQGPGSGSGVGIYAAAGGGASVIERLTVQNVIITGMGSHGMMSLNNIMSIAEQCKFVSNGGRGMYVNAGTTWTIRNCWFELNAERGFYATGTISSALTGCGSDLNAVGYELSSCSGITMIGCDGFQNAAGAGGDGTSIKITGCYAITVAGSFISANGAVALWVTGASGGVQVLGFIETAVGGATASIKTDSGCDVLLNGINVATATSYATNTISLIAGSFSFFSAVEAGTLQVDGVATLNGGSSSAGSAPILTAVAGTNGGSAVQLTDVTRDYMVYLEVGTAGTAFIVSMGHTSAGTDVTLHASGTATSGSVVTFLLPAGWFFKWSATTATLAQSVAVGC